MNRIEIIQSENMAETLMIQIRVSSDVKNDPTREISDWKSHPSKYRGSLFNECQMQRWQVVQKIHALQMNIKL